MNQYVTCKTLYDIKGLHIIFNKVDGYIKKDDRTKHLALFPSDEKYKRMFDGIRIDINV